MAENEQKLTVVLSGDSKGVQKSTDEAKDAVASLDSSIKNISKDAEKSTGRLANEIKNAANETRNATAVIKENAAALGQQSEKAKDGSLSLKALGKAADKCAGIIKTGVLKAFDIVSDRIKTVVDGAESLGTSAQMFQLLQQTALESGVKVETVTAAFQHVSEEAKKALAGDTGAINAFLRLGVSLSELQGKKPEQIFNIVASSAQLLADSLGDESGAAAAVQVFGDKMQNLTGVLDTYKDLVDSGFAGPVSDEMVEASKNMEKAMAQLKDTLVYIVNDSGFVSWLNDVCQGLIETSKAAELIKRGTVKDKGKEYNESLPLYRKAIRWNVDATFLPYTATIKGLNWATKKLSGVDPGFRTLGELVAGYKKEGVENYTDLVTPEEIQEAQARLQKRKEEKEQRKKVAEEAQKKQTAANELARQNSEKAATSANLRNAQNAYAAAARRLDSANKQVAMLEEAARQQQESARIAKKSAAVGKASARLASFGFSDRKRGKYAEIDASISSKQSQEAAGERVRYTAAERRRIRAREKAEEELQDAQKSLGRLQKRRAAREQAAEQASLRSTRAEQVAAFRDAGAAAMAAASTAPLKELASAVARLSTQTYIVK